MAFPTVAPAGRPPVLPPYGLKFFSERLPNPDAASFKLPGNPSQKPPVSFLRNKLYYNLKPWMPSRARLALRRWYTRRTRARVGSSWPILPGSETPPPGWTGWPKGKQFAVVLTHDVEGILGLNKCRQVMALERELGFRSTFFFIPEGGYQVHDELRRELVEAGFEVGVHDLHHDGKLYSSYEAFCKRAERINQYLEAWDAAGFRSGFMLHNLDWAHELRVLYEASTFDTDPFEPQPDGVGTIFPFWVPRPRGAKWNGSMGLAAPCNATPEVKAKSLPAPEGYVELPYTLPQDSTLFLLLQEAKSNVWLNKLDWLAQKGGMVLVDTHPDYARMNGHVGSSWEYPVERYKELLTHLRAEYEGAYWQPTAGELAAWFKNKTLNSQPGVLAV